MTDEAQITEASERITTLTSDLLKQLQQEFTEPFTVGAMAVVLEIDTEEQDYVYYDCSDSRNFAQAGLLRYALLAAESS